jgi:hypothetical protein
MRKKRRILLREIRRFISARSPIEPGGMRKTIKGKSPEACRPAGLFHF